MCIAFSDDKAIYSLSIKSENIGKQNEIQLWQQSGITNVYKLFDFEGINEDHRENKQFIVKTESINIVCLLCMWSILLFFFILLFTMYV